MYLTLAERIDPEMKSLWWNPSSPSCLFFLKVSLPSVLVKVKPFRGNGKVTGPETLQVAISLAPSTRSASGT
jgi:hypothetical protein